MGALGRVEGEGGPRVSLTNFEFRYTSAQGRSPCDVPGASLEPEYVQLIRTPFAVSCAVEPLLLFCPE